jgi:hypothetical protein
VGVFRRKIRFAGQLWEVEERERIEAGERKATILREDWERALRDPRLRDKLAGAPGPHYEWEYHLMPSKERLSRAYFENLCEQGFVGTWEEVQTARERDRWGYWTRECPRPVLGPPRWLRVTPSVNGFAIGYWKETKKEQKEELRAYYAILATIHDTYLGVVRICDCVWSDSLRRMVDNWLGAAENVTDLIKEALEKVKQRIDESPRGPQHNETLASKTPGRAARQAGRKPTHDVAFYKRVRDTYEESLGAGVGSKGAWSKAAETHGLASGETARKQCARYLEKKRNRGQN